MGLGLRGGMGAEARRMLKEAYALRVKIVGFANDCHDPETGRFCEKHGVVHRREDPGVGEDDGFGVSRPAKNRARLGKLVEGVPGVDGEELAEIRKVRKGVVTSPRLGFQTFEGEVAPLRRQVNVDKKEEWLSREEFMNKKGYFNGREMSAAERYAQPDLHGLVVVAGGKMMDPFGSSHAVIRLAQTGMPKLINRVVPKVTGEEALSVELKQGRVGGSGGSRFKNRLYMVAGEKGGKKVALNVVIYPDGKVKTAFIERADGNYGDARSVRKLLKDAGVKIPNEVVDVSEFGVERVKPKRR